MLLATQNTIFSKASLLIPLYSCPSDNNNKIWQNILNASKNVNILIIWGIICKNDNYKYFLKKFINANVKPLAYISTNNSCKSLSEIEKTVNFYANYPIKGFFLDEVNNNSKFLNYNNYIIDYIKNKFPDAIIVVNSPYAESNFLENIKADVVVIFENSFNELKNFQIENLNKNRKLAMLVHHVSRSDLKYTINYIIAHKLKYFFITDKNWDSLPSYFFQEVEFLEKINTNFKGKNND